MGIRNLLLTAFLAAGVGASHDHDHDSDTCTIIGSTTNIEVAGPSDKAYTERWYWNAQCAALEPTCVLLPSSRDEVAEIVRALAGTCEKFAVKSGGHNHNMYFSSVSGGPLISTERLNEVTLDNEAETVRVGPGNRWENVIGALDGTGYTVPSGRAGHVGAGGLLLGSEWTFKLPVPRLLLTPLDGLSYLSAQYGWAANSVLEYELVLPNGTAVTASATSHPDLFIALKGGGNNFGIVTSFLMRAYPQSDEIWGGTMIFLHSDETAEELLAALRDFAEDSKDEKAAVILVGAMVPDLSLDLWILYTFYGGPEPPAGVFDDFIAAGPVNDTSATKSYYQLMLETRETVDVNGEQGLLYTMGTETVPLPEAEHVGEVLGAIHGNWRRVSEGLQGNVTGVATTTAYQPFTRGMARIAREKGGDLIDLDDDVDRIIVEQNYFFPSTEEFGPVDRATVDAYEGVRELVQAFQEAGKLSDVYLPLFLNDVYYRQDYFGRVKPERRELAKRVVSEVDPKGWWGSRTGGVRP